MGSSSTVPLLELDFNLHKSNSTFFLDLDHSRIQLLATLFKTVIDPGLRAGPTPDGKLGGLKAALGGTSCIFRREIRLGQRYEIHSRLLCWDEKWIYIVSHFVRPGGSGNRATASDGLSPGEKNMAMGERIGNAADRAIFASAISKYVFKQGRKTILPMAVLDELGMLPGATTKDREEVMRLNAAGEEIARCFAGLDKLHGTFMRSDSGVLETL